VALTVRMIMASDSAGDVQAALGWDEVRLPSSARPGDDLSLVVECGPPGAALTAASSE